MGNNQSSNSDVEKCCRVLCWGTPPAAKDDGEWFGELPRDKKRRKSKRSRSQKNLDKMPVVPEVSVHTYVTFIWYIKFTSYYAHVFVTRICRRVMYAPIL